MTLQKRRETDNCVTDDRDTVEENLTLERKQKKIRLVCALIKDTLRYDILIYALIREIQKDTWN